MENKSIKTNPFQRKKNRTTNYSLNMFDLPSMINDLKGNQTWNKEDIKTRVLLKSREKQILLTALHDATEIDSYQANESITFQIMEGKVRLNIRNESVILGQGQLFTIQENIKYTLTTKEETVLLITITGDVLQMADN